MTRALGLLAATSVVWTAFTGPAAQAAPGTTGPSAPGFPQSVAGKPVPKPAPARASGPAKPGPDRDREPTATVVTPPRPGTAAVAVAGSFAPAGTLPVKVAARAVAEPLVAAEGRPAVPSPAPQTPQAPGTATGKIRERMAAVKPPADPALGVVPGKASRWPVAWTPPASASAPPAAATPSAAAQAQAQAPASVSVQTLDPAVVNGFGARFIGFTVTRADGGTAPGAVSVQVDYSSVAKAYGGGFASRMTLLQFPACALTTPTAPGCRTGTPVGSVADPVRNVLTAVVTADPAGTAPQLAGTERASRAAVRAPAASTAAAASAAVFALAADDSSAGGSYTATPLKASDGWVVGEQAGGFAYSYPLPAAPATGGVTPSFALSYDSGSVDGLTSSENNQSSPVGLGWQLAVPFIEQRFTPCTNSGLAGHQCWAGGRATLSLNGQSAGVEYIGTNQAGDRDQFRMQEDDPGWRIERVFPAAGSNPNGDDGGVYWKVTTTDGTQYFFGRENSAWSSTPTNSTLTVPMFAQSSSDVCWSNSGHECRMAWRWNLAYVVDRVGNLQTYQWEKARYSYQASGAGVRRYDGAGYLTAVLYGNRTDGATAAPAPQKIDFGYGYRCDFAGCRAPVPHDKYAANYPDVPFDQWCGESESGCSSGPTSPVYFYLKKLETVTATVATGSGYRPVERVSLDQGWPRWRDQLWSTVMWLRTITRTGYAADGTTQALPAVSFGGDYDPWPANRWDATPVADWYQNKPRINDIWTELGGRAHVTYGQPNACSSQTLDGNEDKQTTDCFPSREPNGHQAWFRRYLVTKLEIFDRYGAPTQTTSYEYDTSTGAAWHSDNDPIVPKDQQSWSDYRGYRKVTVREGTPGGRTTITEKRFFTGMAEDHLKNGSTRWVEVKTAPSANAATSELSYPDWREWKGLPLEERVLRADGSEVSATQHEYGVAVLYPGEPGPWGIYQRTVPLVWESLTREMTTAGGVARKYQGVTRNTVDQTFGLPISTQDDGDPIRGTGPTCSYTTYATNADAHIIDTEASEVTATGACPSDGSAPAASDLIERTDTYYDANFTSLTAAPTAGLATKVVKWASKNGTSDSSTSVSASKYDAYGRVVGVVSPDNFTAGATSFDTAGPATVTSFTTTNGVVTGQSVTGPSGQTTSQVIEPGRQQPTSTTDQNGHVTTLTYDPLGRITAVRMPGDDYDSKTFSYTVSDTAPSVVVTSQYPAKGAAPVQDWAFHDSLGRVFQEQSRGPNGKVMASGARFDDRGNEVADVAEFAADVAPGTVFGQWYDPAFIATLPSQTVTTFDDVDREVAESLVAAGTTKWTSTTAYDGTTTTTTPAPNTGTGQVDVAPTTTVEDLDENVVSKSQGGKTTTYQFDVGGDMVRTTAPSGAVTTYTYDWLGRRTSTSDPNAGTTTTDYYPSGNVKHSRDAKGADLFNTQDVLGRPLATYAGTDDKGALLSRIEYDGVPLGASAALKGTTTSETVYVGSTPGSGGNAGTPGTPYAERYGYDVRYRVTRTDQVIPGAVGTGLGGTYSTLTEYDGMGREVSTTYPAAGGLPQEKVTSTWTGEYPTALTSPLGSYVNSTGFTDTGQVASRILGTPGATGSVKRSYTWDPAEGKLLSISAATPSTATAANLQADLYSYSTTGDVTKNVDQLAGQQQCYTYDTLDRLTAALTSAVSTATGNGCTADTTGPVPYHDTYTYDADANLTASSHNGVTTTFGYGANTALGVKGGPNASTSATSGSATTALDYDANGQLVTKKTGTATTSYTWDEQEHLVSITSGGTSARFVYGPDDERWVRVTATETVVYLAGQELHLATGASTPTAVRYYKLADHTVGERKTTAGGPANGTLSWILSDRQESASVAVDSTTGTATRDRYLPYGGNRANPSSTTAWTMPTDRGWLGQIQDKDTGLDYLQARYYDPVLTHFVSTDPENVQDDPQSANPYGYAAGNPITYYDPDGLWPKFISNIANKVSSAASSAASWVSSNKDTIVSIGVSVAAGAALCATGVGCAVGAALVAGAVGGAAGYATRVVEKKETFSVKGLVGSMASGAVTNAVPGGIGAAIGKAARPALKAVAAPARRAATSAFRASPRTVKATSSSAKSAARGCGHSFAAETPVVMAGGELKPIGDVRVGDVVIAADPATGLTAARSVVAVHDNHDSDLVKVDLVVEEAAGDAELSFETTASHPFYDAGSNTWKSAGELRAGDVLKALDGRRVTVARVTVQPGADDRRDLTVEDLHTYFVAAEGTSVLVHNCPNSIGGSSGSGRSAGSGKASGGKPAAAKPATGKPAAAKPAGGKPAAAKPAGGKPAAGKPDYTRLDRIDPKKTTSGTVQRTRPPALDPHKSDSPMGKVKGKRKVGWVVFQVLRVVSRVTGGG